MVGKNKPFTKAEMKILVYNRVKKGMTYENAVKDVQKLVKETNKSAVKMAKMRKIEKKKQKKAILPEYFEAL